MLREARSSSIPACWEIGLDSNEPRKAAKTTALPRALAGFLENNSAGREETVGECLSAEEMGGVYKATLEPISKAGESSRGGAEV